MCRIGLSDPLEYPSINCGILAKEEEERRKIARIKRSFIYGEGGAAGSC